VFYFGNDFSKQPTLNQPKYWFGGVAAEQGASGWLGDRDLEMSVEMVVIGVGIELEDTSEMRPNVLLD
jgi:hypothetical protein